MASKATTKRPRANASRPTMEARGDGLSFNFGANRKPRKSSGGGVKLWRNPRTGVEHAYGS